MTLADELTAIPGRVKLGAARLDTFYGLEWVWKIDLQHFDMYDEETCIGAQLSGSFEIALEYLGFEDNGFTHGLWIEDPEDRYSAAGISLYFDSLTGEWFIHIVDLRSQRLHLWPQEGHEQ